MPDAIQRSGAGVDLSARVFQSVTVAASPAGATETTICTVTLSSDLFVGLGVLLTGWAAFTVGTNGTACRLRIRQTNTSGATKSDSGATTGGIAAANLCTLDCQGIDTAPSSPTTNQVYVLTLTVTGGSATSTVSGVQLTAFVI